MTGVETGAVLEGLGMVALGGAAVFLVALAITNFMSSDHAN
jgi:hypothetical protein